MTTAHEFLNQAAHKSPSADNSQPWHLTWQNNVLSVKYDTQRIASKTFAPDNPAIFLTMGAILENLIQASLAINWPVAWEIAKTFDPDEPIYFNVIAKQINRSINLPEEPVPLFYRHTDRFSYQKKKLPDSQIRLLKKLTNASTRVMVFEAPHDKYQISHLVRQASQIRFQTREIHEWLGKSLRFGHKSEESNDGLDVKTLDLPLGGKLFLRLISSWKRMNWLNILGAYKTLSLIDSMPIKKAPALVAIISPNGLNNILSAGQLMERIWIDLNSQGIAVHPYYVVADQLHRREAGVIPNGLKKRADEVFDMSKELFQLNQEESLQMLLRIGYPTKNPVFSKRLPIETVCTELTE